MEMIKTELLAPAGNEESLHAAVCAGADAVYLGVDSFNARQGADNFTLESLGEACDYAHLRGVLVYLALNTVVLPREVAEVMELARQAYRRGVDAFIVQDIGVAAELTRTLPAARLHISTQMNTHTEAGVRAAAALGAKRVTLARELSLEEVEHLSQVAAELGLETEAFVHGALCVCYSGQCFMSSMVGGRSANRGSCAQACRLPYTLHNKALRKTLAADGEHLLSPKDLCAVELLPALCAAGVSSFKIEGRMKSSSYVSTVVSVYRRALDDIEAATAAADAGASYSVSDTDNKKLAEVFSRGFTTAYLEHHRNNDIMSYARPNNRGVFVGRVASVRGDVATIAAEDELHVGDVLEFWTNKGHFAYPLSALERDGEGNIRVTLPKQVGKGDRIFRVRNVDAGFTDDRYEPRVPVVGEAVLRVGEPLIIRFRTRAGECAEAQGQPIEAARTKAVTEDEVREHIDRLGNLPFSLDELTIDLDDNVGIGFSQLHKIRTRALELLEEEILSASKNRVLPRVKPRDTHGVSHRGRCEIVAWATNPACARAAKRAGVDAIYVPALNYKRGEAVIAGQVSGTAEQAGYPNKVIMALPTVEHDLLSSSREMAVGFDTWSYVKPGKPVFVESLGQLARAVECGALPEVGPHLPLLNGLALQVAADLGAKRAWLSPELSLAQIEDLGKSASIPLGLTITGSQELMVTEHCVLMSQGPCDEVCEQCARRKSPHYLKDRKGYELPVVTDCMGRSHIYNAVALEAAHAMSDLVSAGVTSFMIDTTLMNVEETTAAVQRAVRARNIAVSDGNKVSKVEGATSGLLFRGIQ